MPETFSTCPFKIPHCIGRIERRLIVMVCLFVSWMIATVLYSSKRGHGEKVGGIHTVTGGMPSNANEEGGKGREKTKWSTKIKANQRSGHTVIAI